MLVLSIVMDFLVIPIGGWMVSAWTGINWWWMLLLDLAVVAMFEAALRGPALAGMVLAKALVPAGLVLWLLPRTVEAPTPAGWTGAGVVMAGAAAGVAWFLLRAAAHPIPDGGWPRFVAALVCLTAAAATEVTVAGSILTMGQVNWLHLLAAAMPAPVWWGALRWQIPTRPRLVQVRILPPLVPTPAGGPR